MPDNLTLGRLELIVRSNPPGNIWSIPALALIMYFGWTAFRQDGWVFKAIGAILLLLALLGAIGFFLRTHQRIALYEHALLLYETYPSRAPDQRIALETLTAVQVDHDPPRSYRLTFARHDQPPLSFTLDPLRAAGTATLGQLLARLAARGIPVTGEAARLQPADPAGE